MVLKTDQERIKALLKDTITLLCRNGLTFKTEFSIEALIGITLDQDDVLLVNINEIVRTELGNKLAAAAQESGQSANIGGDDWDDNYSDEGSQNSPSHSSSGRKRKRKRRRSKGSKAENESDGESGDSITGADDANSLSEPPMKRSLPAATSRVKNSVKQEHEDEDDDGSKDIVFIKEEVDSGDWANASSSQGQDGFASDLSGIPSNSSMNQQQENFDFLQGNSLIPMSGSAQQNASLWSDMTGRQNITSPASKRTSTVTTTGAPGMGDESQQIQYGSGGSSIRTDDERLQQWDKEIKDEVHSPDSPSNFDMDLPFSTGSSTDSLRNDSCRDSVTVDSDPYMQPDVTTPVMPQDVMPPPNDLPLGKAFLNTSVIPDMPPIYGIKKPSGAGPNEKQFRLSASGQLGQVCPTCSKVLTSPRGYKLHVDAHKGIFPLHCQFCNRGFLSNSALRGHLVVHTNKKEFKCMYCAKEFKYRNGLDYHHAFCRARYKNPESE